VSAWQQADLWTAPDGARLSVRRMPAAVAHQATAIFVHGWGDHTGRWTHVAEWFAGRGIAFYGADQRGHGQTPGRRGHVERFAQYLADLAALRKLVAAESPGPQILVGHSYGGFIVLRYLETAPQGVAGACLLAPFVELFEEPPRWKVLMARLLADVLPWLPITTGLEYDDLSRDAEVVRTFHDDPLCHERMTPRAYREMMTNLAILPTEQGRIAGPLFVALAGDDRITSTPAADAFARSLPGDVAIRQYAGMYHNILHEPDRDRVFADLEAWLAAILTKVAA
jgi:alpha-beta hydrolase superfamily lysophospholipase